MTNDLLVLIVEDEGRMRELLTRAVTNWQLRAASAATGEEALRQMDKEPANIVLLDLNLPAMSGIECLEQIRQRWPETQVIILTGFGDLESAKAAIHLDVVEFLTKPAHLGQLEQAIDRARRRIPRRLPQVEPLPPEPEDDAGSTKLYDIERQHILATLARHDGNRVATAEELGIALRTLYYRLAEYEKEGYKVE
ncbi:MAG: response regulator transcription factor [Tepidisphaerales bacterium]